nr:MAG TPA: hypothetical protein [Caudoviricetes sp.]
MVIEVLYTIADHVDKDDVTKRDTIIPNKYGTFTKDNALKQGIIFIEIKKMKIKNI